MADLQKALSIPGVYAAGEFTDTGELVAYAGNVSLKTAKMAAKMCAANKMMGKMQASGWTDYTGKDGFEPCTGFAVSGPDNSALVYGNVGVFVRNRETDFDRALATLATL
jgi:roadblock/LC7 domain-containing protein